MKNRIQSFNLKTQKVGSLTSRSTFNVKVLATPCLMPVPGPLTSKPKPKPKLNKQCDVPFQIFFLV